MAVVQHEQQQEAVRVGAAAWAEMVVAFMVVAAVASVGVGIGVANAPEHGWPWVAAGLFAAIGWLASATALNLLARMATRVG